MRHSLFALLGLMLLPSLNAAPPFCRERYRPGWRSSLWGGPAATTTATPSIYNTSTVEVLIATVTTTTTLADIATPTPTDITTTLSSVPAAAAPASGGATSSGSYTGQATFYSPGLGACGWSSAGSDYIVAVSQLLYDSWFSYDGVNPNDNGICGQRITVSYGSNRVGVTVVDRCEGCAYSDLDFSPSAFLALTAGQTINSGQGLDIGRFSGITWSFA